MNESITRRKQDLRLTGLSSPMEAANTLAEWLKDHEDTPLSHLWDMFSNDFFIPPHMIRRIVWREACMIYTNL